MKTSATRRVLLIGLVVGLAIAIGFLYLRYGSQTASGPVPNPPAGLHGPLMPVEGRVVNLGGGGKFNYVKISLTLEVRPATAGFYGLTGDGRVAAEQLELARYAWATPLILDAVGRVASAQSATVLLTDVGRTDLKQSLLDAVRQIVGTDNVLDIYITDLVMQ